MPFKRFSFKDEFGFTMVNVMRKTGAKKIIGSTCAYCGVLRRQIMNKQAREMKGSKLATGHNLDDETQSILMNVMDADLERLLRSGPKSEGVKGMIPRIKPLYHCPEREIIAFAKIAGIKYFEQKCCPFKWQAKRNDFREMVEDFEAKYPGMMFSTVKFLKQVKENAGKKAGSSKLGTCSKCKEPCSGKVCKACKMAERIGEKG